MSKCVVHWQGKEIKFRTDYYRTFDRILSILAWAHKRKFPNAREGEQKAKVLEEAHELSVAYKQYKSAPCMETEREYYYEMADVLFAIHGLRRFDYVLFCCCINIWSFETHLKIEKLPLMIEKLLDVYFIRTYVNNRHI